MHNSELEKLYCLSGLGVDKRVFAYLNLPETELIHIEWIAPQQQESLEVYAQRLFNSHELPEDYNLLGVSFGGMIAIEFAKIRQPHKLFLISTLISVTDLPWKLRIAKTLGMHKIVPASLLKSPNVLTYWFFGAVTTSEKQLLKRILQQTDAFFLKWALSTIINWKNNSKPPAVTIHGSKDRILPPTDKADYIISAGGHFMIVSHAEEIGQIIQSASNFYTHAEHADKR